ncbi:MAG: hypothetical protein K0S29_1310 [Gammaproteobacteria bacterium]|nr:hypothetical protein [Gammaproteobacteria bacterium]
MAEARQWALNAKWLGLKVLAVEFGTEHDQSGAVEFIATYKIHGKVQHIHELSQFEKVQGEWKYVSGNLLIQN